MKQTMSWMTGAIVLATLAGCPSTGAYRPNQQLDSNRFNLSCEGDFDQPPVLSSGKTPVFPIGMLNPDVIEDRKIRHLPMKWPVTSAFIVGVDGRTSGIQATATSPPSFSNHMVVAVRTWRFMPAARNGTPVESRCKSNFVYGLE